VNNKKSVLNGKSFYVALSLSVAMVGAACYFAYTKTAGDITRQLESSVSATEETAEQAADIKTDVSKTEAYEAQSEDYYEAAQVYEQQDYEQETDSCEETEQTEEETEAEETAKTEERKLVMPIEGEILNEFSNGELVKSKTTGAWQTHNGIDISASLGDAVRAADKGTVSAVDSDPLWGITVTIDHGNGVITRYCNLNEGVTVQVGQTVSSGEEIGAVGETADIETSEKSHLHFEALKNGSYVNPLDMM
jgi:murein DD-endopeptidase MepM/ murein hydrolase activator NlpD